VVLDWTEIRCEPDIALWPILGEFVIGTADAERQVHDGSAHHRKGENYEVDAAGAGECEARGQGEDRQRKEVDGVALGGESGGDQKQCNTGGSRAGGGDGESKAARDGKQKRGDEGSEPKGPGGPLEKISWGQRDRPRCRTEPRKTGSRRAAQGK
jgi:hypothetical protein